MKKEKAKKPIAKRWWFWVVVAFLTIGVIGNVMGSDDSKAQNDLAKANKGVEVAQTTVPTSETRTGPKKKPMSPSALETTPEAKEESSKSNKNSKSVESGKHTLPCGAELYLFSSVRNDVTGKWRYSTTSSSNVPADYAVEYYNEMFSSDDEVHGIWNATLGTMTRLNVFGNLLYVDTLEYVDGEEHDANLMFSGALLDNKIYDITTGEEADI